MSLEDTLFATMNHPSEIVGVRKALNAGKTAIMDRSDLNDTLKSINGDNSLTPELRSAAKRFEMTKAADKVRALDAMIAAALADVAPPPVPAAETPGAASIDAELRANFKALPENQQQSLLKNSSATRLAVARAPRELSGLIDQEHTSLRDGILRDLYPDAMQKLDADRKALDAVKMARDMFKSTAHGNFGNAIETHTTVITSAA